MSQSFHDRLDEIASGFQASRILLAANRLRLFQALGDGIKNAGELATELDASRRGTRILCDALVAFGLLERIASGYRNDKEALDLGAARSLLDIGGGPGIYAIEFASRFPALEVTVLDSPESLEVARQNVDAAALTERIHLLPGDAFHTDLGGPYDAIFLSNVIHIYSAAENETLIRRCADSLSPGGQLWLKEFFLDNDSKSPPSGAIFAVNMLVNTEGGDCYSVAETNSRLEDAGLIVSAVTDVVSKSRLLVAERS